MGRETESWGSTRTSRPYGTPQVVSIASPGTRKQPTSRDSTIRLGPAPHMASGRASVRFAERKEALGRSSS